MLQGIILLGIVFLTLVTLFLSAGKIKSTEVTSQEYTQIEDWVQEFPELKEFINSIMYDDQITLGQYTVIEDQVKELRKKNRIENNSALRSFAKLKLKEALRVER